MFVMMGMGLGQIGALLGAGGGISAPPPITAIAADGWRATYPTPPSLTPLSAPVTVTVSRQGFTPGGLATSVADTLTLMVRLREPYPNQTTLSPDQVSLSDFVYAADSIAGVTNGSELAYPHPIACWLTPDLERARGTTFTARLAVAHAYARLGKPVAAVKFIASDGTNTVEHLVSTMSQRQFASGLHAPYFEASINLAILAPATLCTLDVIIYPWVGAAFQASVQGSSYPSVNFTVLRFLNDRSGSYGEAYAYVDASAGNNATALVSATATTAASQPYATVAAAANAIRVFNNATYGRDDAGGGTVRLVAGEHVHSNYAAAASGAMPLVIEAADPAARATTIYKDSGASVTAGCPQKLRISGITLKKVGASVIFLDNSATLATMDRMLVLENVAVDANGTAAYNSWIYRVGRMWLIDTATISGMTTAASNTAKHITAVGSSGVVHGSGTYNMIACTSGGGVTAKPGVGNLQPGEGQLVSHCALGTATVANKVMLLEGAAVGPRGLAVIGSVLEHSGGSTSPAFSVFADNDVSPAENVLSLGNTVVGSRMNWLYQDVGTVTVPKRGFLKFTASLYRNTKTDIFGGNANLVGNWPAAFNVGNLSNAALLGDNSGNSITGAGNWLGEAPCLGSVYGSPAAPLNAAWVNDQSFGAGGGGSGDYTPGPASALPLIPAGLAPYPVDLKGRALADDGTARIGAVQPV